MSEFLIRGGRIFEPGSSAPLLGDVLIRQGSIDRVAERIEPPRDCRVVDADGLVIAPAFLDPHVHFREPGGEASETIETGCRAAARGGFSDVFAMPNTTPACDSPLVVRSMIDRAREACGVRVIPIAAVTHGQRGERLCDFASLASSGAGAFSDDGRPVENAAVMRRAMQCLRDLGGLIMDHCEDLSLTGAGVMHEGVVSARLGLSGIPRSSESTIAARDCALALETGCRLHICHVSNGETVEVVRWYKSRGAPVTTEVSPHHLTLTDEAVAIHGPLAKMKPPLCADSDRDVLIAALEDGTIDCIATDHAPHSPASKDTTMDAAPFGIIGLETAFPVLHTAFVVTGRWTLGFLLDRIGSSARCVVGLPALSVSPGAAADFVLIDPSERFTLGPNDLGSRSRNSPWLGAEFVGRPIATIVSGRPAYDGRGLFSETATDRD